MMILILEDDADRVRRFRAAASVAAPAVPVAFWRDAHAMTADFLDRLEHASLLSLDHDLVPAAGADVDPGTSYDVARYLAELLPCCPVIIHTSNAQRGRWMHSTLAAADWSCHRVHPYDDDWIERQWAPLVTTLVRGPR